MQPSLTSALLVRDKISLAIHIAPYMDQGKPKYPALFSVPRAERLPAMAQENLAVTLTVVSAAVGLYLSTSGVNETLAVDIAEAILEDSATDQLTLQDLIIFLKGAAAGKYGAFTRNVPTPMDFMKMFEGYRQERHEAIINIREEQHAQLKAQGPPEREAEDWDTVKQIHKTAVIQHFIEQNK